MTETQRALATIATLALIVAGGRCYASQPPRPEPAPGPQPVFLEQPTDPAEKIQVPMGEVTLYIDQRYSHSYGPFGHTLTLSLPFPSLELDDPRRVGDTPCLSAFIDEDMDNDSFDHLKPMYEASEDYVHTYDEGLLMHAYRSEMYGKALYFTDVLSPGAGTPVFLHCGQKQCGSVFTLSSHHGVRVRLPIADDATLKDVLSRLIALIDDLENE